jgi:[ribosomal protein S5]-alanine N-acetyltransferase
MELHTERLHLTLLNISDAEKIHELHSLKEIDEFNTLGIPENFLATELLVKQWVDQIHSDPPKSHIYCIRLSKTSDFIGLIGLKIGKINYKSAEVWFKLSPTHWRQGFATEALGAMLNFSFNELKLHRIEAGCAVENLASINVLEKVGMTREGRKRKILPIRGNWVDNYFYAILDEDYFS